MEIACLSIFYRAMDTNIDFVLLRVSFLERQGKRPCVRLTVVLSKHNWKHTHTSRAITNDANCLLDRLGSSVNLAHFLYYLIDHILLHDY